MRKIIYLFFPLKIDCFLLYDILDLLHPNGPLLNIRTPYPEKRSAYLQ
jgi:hypothetical protein